MLLTLTIVLSLLCLIKPRSQALKSYLYFVWILKIMYVEKGLRTTKEAFILFNSHLNFFKDFQIYISSNTSMNWFGQKWFLSEVKEHLNRIDYLLKQLVTYRGEIQAQCHDFYVSCDVSNLKIPEPDSKKVYYFLITTASVL